ncbi:hypothetical protein A2Z33_02910 [Candidatus Gottesmanbacteria bacterium RBG_16_52_11]|uniref:Glycosyltransferase RgtA/B/C/D-like domain-containing protein n=1 Tax=Candidatus Gottesmanbacteria bacterium RBG_16_52_11 TaxID=1798374 RepID=A0A1F5YMA8_9BACT|nr:MAG: hypothetical protein A2Z33_02910 [Candidatus Gottesmanbacteria bacterium RBG_16_52_11]
MTADRLDAILLFAFVLPVIFRYKILPGEVTPYWLFGLLFAVLTINTALSFFRDGLKGFLKINYEKIRTVLTVSVVTAVIVGVMGGAIVDRGRIAPGQNFGVHDIILQLEAALTKLSDGVNPYDTTYFGTPLEDWHYDELGKPAVNPALYHFVMPPFYLVSAFPLRFISIRLFGFFDGRMPLLLAAVGLIAVLVFYFRKPELKRTAIIFTLLSPATIDFLIEGRSDMFALFFLVLSLYFLGKDRLIASVVVFALGMASKQTVWFALPAYIFLALHHTGYGKKFFVCTAVLTAVLAAVFFPFLAWNPGAFLDSVVFYLSGNTARGYPVSDWECCFTSSGCSVTSTSTIRFISGSCWWRFRQSQRRMHI